MTNKKKRILDNPSLYMLLGLVIAILIARSYIYLGGDIGLGYDGITFHHIFLGIILVLISGITFFSLNDLTHKNKKFMYSLAFIFGFGMGLITDETNFLVSVGENYNLSDYYKPLNTYVDVIFIGILLFIFVYSFFKTK
ncbi:MAG: hypothetical protein CSMARM5_0064 [Candidatus Parvarchaeum acidophilus ARMAN-5_'5-way FS']|jgi:membrane protease YdiL (CAAX protease family)|nr:MAG: hypothetical protein CSMARM5_0064 [Candidatus Parvarchaeum acidophilus ARMAN-5_'5-way FS']